MSDENAFKEAQRFEGPWWLFYKAPRFAIGAALLGVMILGAASLWPQMRILSLVAVLASLLALVVSVQNLYSMHMNTDLANSVLQVEYWQTASNVGRTELNCSDMVSCKAIPCGLLHNCGIDPTNSKTTVIVLANDMAVRISLANGKEYVIGSKRADELAMAIKGEMASGEVTPLLGKAACP